MADIYEELDKKTSWLKPMYDELYGRVNYLMTKVTGL